MPNDTHEGRAHSAPQGPTLTVQGIAFPLPTAPKYSEGHVLSSIEASVLNQTWAENIRNNWAGRVKATLKAKGLGENPAADTIPAEVISELTTEFGGYAAAYEFAMRTARQPLDPVEHLARKLAKDVVLSALRGKGYDVKSLPAEQLEGYITAILEKKPELRKEAVRRIKETKKVAESVFADLGIDAPEAA